MLGRFPNKPAFVGRLLRSTLEYYKNAVADLHSSLEEKDSNRVFELVHALKSTAGNLCAPALFKTAEQLLGAGREQIAEKVSEVHCLMSQLEQVLREAQQWLDQSETKAES